MRNRTIFILILLLFACEQKNPLEKYIQKPAMNDSMCLKDIVEAKKDIINGKLVFCTPMGMGTHQIRQEKPLIELCKTYNLAFDYEMFGCIVYEGQTEGCYGAYMDKAIEDKYGKRFKKILLAKADSILLMRIKG